MISETLFDELQKLDRGDKLRIIQILAGELAVEENAPLQAGATYEVWSPFDASDAANTLLKMLEDDEKQNG